MDIGKGLLGLVELLPEVLSGLRVLQLHEVLRLLTVPQLAQFLKHLLVPLLLQIFPSRSEHAQLPELFFLLEAFIVDVERQR